MVEIIKSVLYTCDCGYKTTSPNQACKHSKTQKCQSRTINKRDVEFVFKEDYDNKDRGVIQNGEFCTSIGNNNSNVSIVNINLTVPDKSVVQSVYDAVKNPECVAEIRAANPQEIPAILFKYTRGAKAEGKFLTFDPDKNVVRQRDPITGREVAKDLKKYRNEYLEQNADVYDKEYHIPYMPPSIQPAMRELATPEFDNGKKKDDPIPGADVIKMCASGDHRMYKLPQETKKFYNEVAVNVDKEIKSTA